MARIITFLPWLAASCALAQFPGLSLPPSGDNQKAAVTQFVGPVRVTIEYSSPKVHSPTGEDRRGKIWGKLVPYGMANLGFGNGKPSPWRGGANENTVLEVSHSVLLEGKPLAAGRYGLHFLPAAEGPWTLIVSKNYTSWGSFFYEESEDVMRVPVNTGKHDYREWLTYEFTERKPASARVELQWEDLSVGWGFQVPEIEKVYVSSMAQDLRNMTGFQWNAFVNAAQYCVQNNTNLEQALEWSDAAINRAFVGQANFTTLSTKAQVLRKMKRDPEADKVMTEALHLPNVLPAEIHMYGRSLQAAGKQKEAMEVFEFNAKRFGDVWPTHVGLTRAYSAAGELPKALEHAKKALAQAPDELNRKNLEQMVQALEAGQPVK